MPASVAFIMCSTNQPSQQSAAACRVWHSCIRQPARWVTLAEDAENIMALRQAGLSFWIGPGDTPRCLLEQLAVSILRAHLKPMNLGKSLECSCGAEWWVQHRRSDESIQLHFDADEKLKTDESRHVTPFLATVTYLSDGGAPTLVLPVAADTCGRWRCADDATSAGAFLSYPRSFKHLAFDGRLLHGAPQSLATDASASRITILVNVWLGQQPRDTERIPQALADKCTAPLVAAMDDFLLESESMAVQPTASKGLLPATEIGYPFPRPTLAAALRMRRLPVPGDGTLASDADFIHVPAEVLGLRLRAREVDDVDEQALAAAPGPVANPADDAQARQWAADSALEELD